MDNLICINKNLCMSKDYFFILLFIFIIITIYYIYNTKKNAQYEIHQYKQIIDLIHNNQQNHNHNNQQNHNHNNQHNHNHNNQQNQHNHNHNNQQNHNLINNLINNLPIRKLLEYRDRSILYDPIVPPERRIDMDQYPLPIINKINIPTRGYPDNYQLVGLLSRSGDEKILQLFGRPTFPGSNQYEYYTTTETNGFANKIPIDIKGKKEIEDGTSINVPIFDKNKGDFQVKLYNYDTPRYNPNIY